MELSLFPKCFNKPLGVQLNGVKFAIAIKRKRQFFQNLTSVATSSLNVGQFNPNETVRESTISNSNLKGLRVLKDIEGLIRIPYFRTFN